jgi:hypothetical protein
MDAPDDSARDDPEKGKTQALPGFFGGSGGGI